MAGSYKVRYRKGDLEIEVESNDRTYVEAMVASLRSDPSDAPLNTAGKADFKNLNEGARPEAAKPGAIDIAAICKAIKGSEDYPAIQQNILTTTNQLGRVLLSFVAARDVGYKSISTGDVAKITAGLGVSLSQSNASKVIAKNADLFTAGKERKQGSIIPYRLNRNGRKAYSNILGGR
jgi:hypothetical protein